MSSQHAIRKNLKLSDPHTCQKFIDQEMSRLRASVVYGGYLEKRNLYLGNINFQSGEDLRNIHLGIDFWTKVGTKVVAPLPGQVHSFKNNTQRGDYGPTIILSHRLKNFSFFTLYGHLSVESLNGLYKGKRFEKGDILGALGSSDINVNYAPHLHFQVIMDLEGNEGDYPGVCSQKDLQFYKKNCPDPNCILKMN
ncbi:peptidoglycan DD-metalloendopeptidase family protein [Pareuzebyella sediminis]|uniref:peptidoglycan DD-metalloendopeptidase family protein n=1 Tax=Pareuzebyella sediminis TaxID=2607998 RepID=UPI0011EE08A1|nr:peptidoglycan DD-metalloendopeptidase family protein [Pareuzebyella sediminis]